MRTGRGVLIGTGRLRRSGALGLNRFNSAGSAASDRLQPRALPRFAAAAGFADRILPLYRFPFSARSIPEVVGTKIEKSCQNIFPLQNVYIRKVKVLKKPKFDIVKFMELHGDAGASGEDKGDLVDNMAAEQEEGLKGSGGRL